MEGISDPGTPWFITIYIVFNLSILHITSVIFINEERKNPEKKTYTVKGIRYKIDKVVNLFNTTLGIGLWILIFCLDIWSIGSIVSASHYGWVLYHFIRQLITIPIALLWAFAFVMDLIQKADIEERDNDG